jgi:hypothetical protein
MRWIPNWDTLDDSGGASFIANGIALTVRDATADKYRGSLRHVIMFMVKRNYPLELSSFCKFLSGCRRQGAAGSTLEGYRSAMVWSLRCTGASAWADDPLLIRAIKGFKYQDRLIRQPRGAVDCSMLEELCGRNPDYAVFYIVIFFGVFRVSQALALEGGDASCTADGRVMVTVRADKRMKCGNTRQVVSQKEVVHPRAKEIILTALRSVPHGVKVFASLDPEKASLAVKLTAIALRWPAGLLWDGVHCLRHGGVQLMRVFLSEL